jgi:hypothetical protein
MRQTRLYPIVTILLFSLLLFTCKKKDEEPEDTDTSGSSTLDYRNQYCGTYNVTFTTTASGSSLSESKQVTVRKAETGEKATASSAPVEECVTLLNLPSGAGGKLTVQLDAAGQFNSADLDLNLGGKKFDLYFLNSGVSPTKTVRGQGSVQ